MRAAASSSEQQRAAAHVYLSVRVLMVLVVAGVVILLDEAKIFLPLPLQDALSPLCISWEVTLRGGDTWRYLGKQLNPRCNFSAHFSSTFYLKKASCPQKPRTAWISWPSLNTNQTSPPGNRLHYTLLPKKTFCCLTKCFVPLLGCTYPRVCVWLSDISCESAASLCGPWLNKAKEKRSEENLSLLKATAGSRAALIVIKFKSSRRVFNITASCESSSLLLHLVVVILLYVFCPMCWSKTKRVGLI